MYKDWNSFKRTKEENLSGLWSTISLFRSLSNLLLVRGHFRQSQKDHRQLLPRNLPVLIVSDLPKEKRSTNISSALKDYFKTKQKQLIEFIYQNAHPLENCFLEIFQVLSVVILDIRQQQKWQRFVKERLGRSEKNRETRAGRKTDCWC